LRCDPAIREDFYSSKTLSDAPRHSLILGLESSCDETAAAIVRDGRQVLASVVASQNELHEKFGGVVPEIASRAHIERIIPIIDDALAHANVALHELDAIAVGNRPGLIGSLLVGVSAAKALAWSLDRPLIGVDHVVAHLYAAALDAEEIAYPALGVVVSGGHTSLYAVRNPLDMKLLGRTIDDAVGEAYDKVAAILELGFPGGPLVDRLAQGGNPKAVDLPRTMLDPQSLDFSFSGLKTAVLYHVRGLPKGRGAATRFERSAADLSDQQKADVCASFQRAAVQVLMAKMQRALARMTEAGAPPRSVIIGGGVSANSELRARAVEFGASNNLPVRLPKMSYCVDNAAMIAGLAHHHLCEGHVDPLTLEAAATSRY
jgi:N6-L-threonylcarbamoyladenine synthase